MSLAREQKIIEIHMWNLLKGKINKNAHRDNFLMGHTPFFSHITYSCGLLVFFHLLLGFTITKPWNYLTKRNTDKSTTLLHFLKKLLQTSKDSHHSNTIFRLPVWKWKQVFYHMEEVCTLEILLTSGVQKRFFKLLKKNNSLMMS